MKNVIVLSLLGVAVMARAQDITYIPDPSKKAQIQVMELGLNTLQPQYYYQLLHNSYYKNANSVTSVKESLRLQAGVGSNPQVAMADSIKEDLESRAKVEALNVTDRLTDVAWLTEGSKIEKKIATYRQNLLYLTGKGPAWYGLLPLVSLWFLLPCFALWRFGLRHYRSAGS